MDIPIRPRRNRRSKTIRDLTMESRLHPAQLVYPLFLLPGRNRTEAISTLPGQYRTTVDEASRTIEQAFSLGVKSFILFPVVPEEEKDKTASYSLKEENFYLRGVETLKNDFPEACFISDVAMDPYSSDGHDGLVKGGRIINDETLFILGEMALAQAEAGFDYIAPSDMMDGRVSHIRKTLDSAGYSTTGIISYAAKFASNFYGPFREALDSTPKDGSKETYQLQPANRREALREVLLDIGEGADMVMVKPAIHYLDIISDAREISKVPVAAYHVSGECAMLHLAAEKGFLSLEQGIVESLTAIHRAGANVIVTYFALEAAKLMGVRV